MLARGAVTVYEARGQYQLQVAEIQPRGQGTLQQRFEELKRRLQAEGLFELERKRELPVFPETVGIVTSLQGAVLAGHAAHPATARAGYPPFVRGVRVQGIGAEHEIADAVRLFGRENAVDVLIVARGGGSLEDLWCFNEEVVARALAASPMPTISAVGHETDFTIADFVADLRAPTPSAAAELLTRDWSEWRETIATLHRRMDRQVRGVTRAASASPRVDWRRATRCASLAASCASGRSSSMSCGRRWGWRRNGRSNRGATCCACAKRSFRPTSPGANWSGAAPTSITSRPGCARWARRPRWTAVMRWSSIATAIPSARRSPA